MRETEESSDFWHSLDRLIGGCALAIDRPRGNNRGTINGWVSPNAVYGRAISVESAR